MINNKSQTTRKIIVYFDTLPLRSGHIVRGIGSYTKNLLENLKKRNEIILVNDKKDADVIHYPYFDFFFRTLKINKGENVVVTVFDAIPLIYSREYPVGITGKINFFRQKKELKKAKAVITISETSKKDIVRFLDILPDKIFPIHLAPADCFKRLKIENFKLKISKQYSLPEHFVLYVGDVNYNKNISGLIKAFKTLKQEVGLVLVGKAFKDGNIEETKNILNLIKQLKLQEYVKILGFVPSSDLVKIYNLAAVYVQPSFYEGFGLPVLEAMASGIPVVAGKTQGLVEIGGNASLYAEPSDTDDFVSQIKRILNNRKLAKHLVKLGSRNVQNYSWAKTRDATINVYKKTNF